LSSSVSAFESAIRINSVYMITSLLKQENKENVEIKEILT